MKMVNQDNISVYSTHDIMRWTLGFNCLVLRLGFEGGGRGDSGGVRGGGGVGCIQSVFWSRYIAKHASCVSKEWEY